MGVRTDAASVLIPFRPTPAALAAIIWDLDPRASDVDVMPDIPEPPDFRLANWGISKDSTTRIYFSDDFAASFPRLRGYVAVIDARFRVNKYFAAFVPPHRPLFSSKICVGHFGADNTDTGYRYEVVCRLPYRIRDFGSSAAEASWIFPGYAPTVAMR